MENNKQTNTKSKADIIKQVLQLILFLSLGVFFIWLSTKGLTPEDKISLKESISCINNPVSWYFLFLSLIAGALAHYFRALRSVLLIEPLNYKIRKSMSFYAVMVCYLANLAFPRLGEVLRCTFLQRYEKVPFQKSLGTIVTERVLDVIIWLVLLIVVILMNTSVLSNLIVDKENAITFAMWIENKGMSLLTNYFLYIAVAAFVAIGLAIFFTRKWWGQIPIFVKIKNIIIEMWQGLISIKDVKHPILFTVYTLLIWAFYFLGTYLCFFAFDFLAQFGPFPAFSVLIFGAVGFMVAQGGLGAYPMIVAGVLVLYGVNYSAGLAAGWVGWGVQTVMIIVFGFISLILASLMNRTSDNKTEISSEI